jgi:hypothetical protein
MTNVNTVSIPVSKGPGTNSLVSRGRRHLPRVVRQLPRLRWWKPQQQPCVGRPSHAVYFYLTAAFFLAAAALLLSPVSTYICC